MSLLLLLRPFPGDDIGQYALDEAPKAPTGLVVEEVLKKEPPEALEAKEEVWVSEIKDHFLKKLPEKEDLGPELAPIGLLLEQLEVLSRFSLEQILFPFDWREQTPEELLRILEILIKKREIEAKAQEEDEELLLLFMATE